MLKAVSVFQTAVIRKIVSLSLSVAFLFPPFLCIPVLSLQCVTSSHLKPQVSASRDFSLSHFNWLYLDTSHFLLSVE